ncbi:MAG: S24 family peptidase [bacterium]
MDNLAYRKIGGLNSKEAFELTCFKKNPLICKNFTVKAIDKDGLACVMENDSMSPTVKQKDIFTVSPFRPEDFVDGDLYVAYLKDEYLIYIAVKRVFRGRFIGELILKSDGCGKDYEDIVLKWCPEEIIIGKLTSLCRIF